MALTRNNKNVNSGLTFCGRINLIRKQFKEMNTSAILILFISANLCSYFISWTHFLGMSSASLLLLYHVGCLHWLLVTLMAVMTVAALAHDAPMEFSVCLVHGVCLTLCTLIKNGVSKQTICPCSWCWNHRILRCN